MPPSVEKTGSDPRGKQPVRTEDWMRELFGKKSYVFSALDYMRLWDITADELWQFRHFIWEEFRNDSGYRSPVDEGDFIKANRPVSIWQLQMSPKSDWCLDKAESAVALQFPKLRSDQIHRYLRQYAIIQLPRKDIKCMKNSKNLQDAKI